MTGPAGLARRLGTADATLIGLGSMLGAGIFAAFAEFERSMIRSRVQSGIDRAKASGKRLGRPTTDARVAAAVRASLAEGTSIRKAAEKHGVGISTVQRIKSAAAP